MWTIVLLILKCDYWYIFELLIYLQWRNARAKNNFSYPQAVGKEPFFLLVGSIYRECLSWLLVFRFKRTRNSFFSKNNAKIQIEAENLHRRLGQETICKTTNWIVSSRTQWIKLRRGRATLKEFELSQRAKVVATKRMQWFGAVLHHQIVRSFLFQAFSMDVNWNIVYWPYD